VATATHSHEEWRRVATSLEPRSGIYLDAGFTDAASGETCERINPATGDVITEVAAGDAADIDRAVTAARRAFEAGEWSQAAPADRKRVLLRLAELIREHGEELALLDSLDMGKPVEDAVSVDVPGAAGVFQWYGEAADKLCDEVAPTGAGDVVMVTCEPLGVVGAVVPWNFPLDLASWKLAPALVAGNSVILKPAEQSPLSALRLGELASAAGLPGLPAGVLNVVPGFGETAGRALGLDPDIDASPLPARPRSASSFFATRRSRTLRRSGSNAAARVRI
jgi:gamma-glutamyl-gamma-aminobutyraldehyde dehydrogenase